MKKLLLMISLLLGIMFFAQTQRFFYEYKFIPDINVKDSIKTEMMILDINKDGSKYYNHAKFVSDSIAKAEIEQQIKSGVNNFNISRKDKQGGVSYSVTKSYPDYKVYLFKTISSDKYKIAEDQKPEWKILSEKEKIGEYNTQKASTTFGGREWTAWFTTDIPIQDGPYKFYGLPGLIVKIEDKTGSHKMTLVGNKKTQILPETEISLPSNMRVFGIGGKDIEVSKKQYNKLWKDYVNDPSKNMREMMMKNTDNSRIVFKVKGSDGKEITDQNQVFREIDKRTKEMLKKDNNPIEPDLEK